MTHAIHHHLTQRPLPTSTPLERQICHHKNINCIIMSQPQKPLSPKRASLFPHNSSEKLIGKHVILAPLRSNHAEALFSLLSSDVNADLWETDLPNGSVDNIGAFSAYIETHTTSSETCAWAIQSLQTNDIVGLVWYMFRSPLDDVVQIGRVLGGLSCRAFGWLVGWLDYTRIERTKLIQYMGTHLKDGWLIM
ncbi:hypothetical protein Q7P37_006692 [Cladosporium fusiforme]